MFRLLTALCVTGSCLAAGSLTLSLGDYGPQSNAVATPDGPTVQLALAPAGNAVPKQEPSVERTPRITSTPPPPTRAPKTSPPPLQLASTSDAPQSSATNESPGEINANAAGELQVAARPSVVRAGPSESAPMLYGFPAGRQVRVASEQQGFVDIVDVESGAQGWMQQGDVAAKVVMASTEPEPAGLRPYRNAAADFERPDISAPTPSEGRRGMFKGRGGLAGLMHRAFSGQ
ncbi:MAG: hypothetical protein ACREDO_06800 [Methyloceanibacter sp.]